jgi:hypothetical protein
LEEVRHLMLDQNMSAEGASALIGYETLRDSLARVGVSLRQPRGRIFVECDLTDYFWRFTQVDKNALCPASTAGSWSLLIGLVDRLA